MRLRLKEVYNYNTYEFTPDTPVSDHISAPYSHEQHRAFMNRFAYYMKDVLAGRDAANTDDNNRYRAAINAKTDAAIEQNEDLQRAVQDNFDASTKANERYADNELELFARKQALALEMLQDDRDAEQAGASSEAERLRQQVIYAMHIIRYAGGRDSGSFGFGNAPSSYYGKGNSLTGIGALDDYRLPNPHSYSHAQVSDVGAPILKLNDDSVNRDRQEESLVEACEEFDAIVQACRDRFASRTADEQAMSTAAMDQLNANVHYAASNAEDALRQLNADSEGAMAGANDVRKQWMSDLTFERTAEFKAVVDAEKDKVNAWFGDQSEWADKLYDSYYKEHLLQTLESRRTATIEALDGRLATSQKLADDAEAQLADQLDAEEAALAAFGADTLAAMEQFHNELEAATAAAAAAINDSFNASAAAENNGKQVFLTDLSKDWAYWIKYLFGYSGYDTALYADYDDTFDYSHG